MNWPWKRKVPDDPETLSRKNKLAEIHKQVEIIKSDQPSMAEQQEALNRIEELSRAA